MESEAVQYSFAEYRFPKDSRDLMGGMTPQEIKGRV